MSYRNEFIQKRRFIIRLGKALHKYGTPAYRLEAHLQEVSLNLGLQSSFMVTPTSLTFVLSEDEDNQEYNHIVRVKPGDIDLGALARIDALVDELSSGRRTLSDAVDSLDDIMNRPQPYSKALNFLAFGGSSGGFAILMDTNWSTVFLSVVMGFVVALMTFWSEKSIRVTPILEPLVALTTALLTSAVAAYYPSINVPLVILSSIIIYIPGLSLTLGLSELAARNLVSGTARVMDAVMLLFKLYFGAFLGVAIAKLFWKDTVYVPTSNAADWTVWIAVTILAFSLIVVFKSRLKDAPWGILAGYIAFGATLLGSLYLGPALGAFVGAFVLGIYSNLFSRIMNLPSSLVLLLGLVMLVPGSKVYIGLNAAILGQPMLNSMDAGSQSFLIFMSLVAGLIFADVALPSQKRL